MAYLNPSEYVTFGLSADVSDAWIAAASAMVDAFCRRSSLLSAAYTERLRVNRLRGSVQLTYGPVSALSAVQVRYAAIPYGSTQGLLAYAGVFGLPGQWVSVDASAVFLDAACGELQLPVHLFGMQYSEVEVTYTAGLLAIPDAIKFACAQIVKNAQATPGLNVRSSKLDTLQTEYFSDALLDTQVKAMLRPFVAERLG